MYEEYMRDHIDESQYYMVWHFTYFILIKSQLSCKLNIFHLYSRQCDNYVRIDDHFLINNLLNGIHIFTVGKNFKWPWLAANGVNLPISPTICIFLIGVPDHLSKIRKKDPRDTGIWLYWKFQTCNIKTVVLWSWETLKNDEFSTIFRSY